MSETIEQRLERYARVVVEHERFGISCYRQVKGDLKELRFWCDRDELDYKTYTNYYKNKIRELRESGEYS